MLSAESPWFLLTHIAGGGAHALVQTVAVAWETTLLALVDSIGSESVLALRYVAPSSTTRGGWTMTDVCELWVASDKEVNRTGPLLLRFRNEANLVDSFQGKVSGAVEGRKLLVRLSVDE